MGPKRPRKLKVLFSMEFQLVGLFCCVGLEQGDSTPTDCRGNLGANGPWRPRDPSLVEPDASVRESHILGGGQRRDFVKIIGLQ
jgi:hypothetical protein